MRYYREGKSSLFAAFFLLLSLITLLSAISLKASAQEGGESYTGVDIVFLVDQSGSMGGSSKVSEDDVSDPEGLRFSGLQEMIERLASYRLNYFHDSDVQFQVAVVYFGSSKTETIVDSTIIDPDTPDQFQSLSKRLCDKVAPGSFKGHLGNTDHWGALKKAKSILEQMQRSWRRGERHLQAVMVITDGDSYLDCQLGETKTYCNEKDEFQVELYQRDLEEYMQSNLPYPPYHFFLAAIDDKNEYWSEADVREYWETLTHNNAEKVDATTMWEFFEEILADLTVNQPGLADKKTTEGQMVKIPDAEDRVAVPPYLQKVEFIIHKPEPKARVKIYRDGQLLEESLTAKKVEVQGKENYIETITWYEPIPGYVTIERPATTKLLRIFMVQVAADVNCDRLSSVPQFIPVCLRCELKSGGKPLPPYNEPRYQLIVKAEIKSTGTISRELNMTHMGQGTYTACDLPVQLGDYTISIAASTQKPDGEPFEVFRVPPKGADSFKVEPTTVHLNVEGKPTALISVPLSIKFVDPDDVEMPIPSEAATFVKMNLVLTREGQETSLPLSFDPAGYRYRGSFTPDHLGTYLARVQGQVENPTTKLRFTAFDEEVSKLEVLPPKLVWDGFSSPWPQYSPTTVAFHLTDQDDQPLSGRVDPSWHLEAEARIQGEGQEEALVLSPEEQGRWKGKFTPENAGNYELLVSVRATSLAGETITLMENQKVIPFTIRQTILVRTVVLRPLAETSYAWRDIFWQPVPLEIDVGVVDKAGAPLPPGEVQQNAADIPFNVELISPTGQSYGPLNLVPGDAPGRYVAHFSDYEPFVWYAHRNLGWYELHVQPVARLKEMYIYQQPEGVSSRIHLGRHPNWWILPLISGVLLVFLIAYALYQTYLHLWSAEGTVTIESGGPLWIRPLRGYSKHKVTFTGRDGLPGNIRKVVVSQPRGQQVVLVDVHLKKGVKMPLGRMFDRARKSLGGGVFVSYERGAGAAVPKISLSLGVLAYSLLALFSLAGLGVTLFAIVVSLG